MPFFRVSFFSINSWTGYEIWSQIPKRVMTFWSRTKGYCFQEQRTIVSLLFWELSNNSETGYQNANLFPKRVVEILKKWAPPRQVTFKCLSRSTSDCKRIFRNPLLKLEKWPLLKITVIFNQPWKLVWAYSWIVVQCFKMICFSFSKHLKNT